MMENIAIPDIVLNIILRPFSPTDIITKNNELFIFENINILNDKNTNKMNQKYSLTATVNKKKLHSNKY